MDVIVTGCAGFIGAATAQQLLDAGHHVTGIDDVNDAYDVRLKQWRLDRLQDTDGFTFYQADIADNDSISPVFSESVDAVFNLAARAGVRYSVENPWIYERTNVLGTLNVLEACRRHDIPKMVLASTSSLYGAHNDVPFHEDDDTDRPLSPYAASKKGAEALAATYTHLHGIDTPVMRYFTVYGPAGRPDMAPLRFVHWIGTGQTLTMYGDGSQQRDFTYVDDIAAGTIAALKVEGHRIFNLGNDSPIGLMEFVHLVESAVGKKAVIEHKPVHRADMHATWADITRAREELGWSPGIGIEEGVGRLAGWWQDQRELIDTLDLGAV